MENVDKRIGVAIFGLGRAGTIHAKNIIANPEFHLLYIVEEDLQRAETFVHENYLTTKFVKVRFKLCSDTMNDQLAYYHKYCFLSGYCSC